MGALKQKLQTPSLPEKRRRLADIEAARGGSRCVMPISPSQEKSWFHFLLEPASCVYVVPLIVKLEGPLDRAALEKSIRDIVRTQEALRIRFVFSGERPLQVVADREDFQVGFVETDQAGLQELIRKNAGTPFDLASSFPFEAKLVKLGPAEHWLLVRTHHSVFDGISGFIFLEQLQALYRDHASGQPSQADRIPSFLGFVEKQLRWNSEPDTLRQLEYWEGRLKGAPARIEWPLQPDLGQERREYPFEKAFVSAEDFALAKDFCSVHGLTPFMLVLCALELSLYIRTRQEDLVIGTITNVRSELGEEAGKAIGEFTNMQALRLRADPELSLVEHLGRVKEEVLGALANGKYPFRSLVEKLNPDRSRGSNPLFNVFFVMHNIEVRESIEMANGLLARPQILENPSRDEQYTIDLSIQANLRGGGLSLEGLFDESRLAGSEARELLELAASLVVRIAKEPSVPLRKLLEVSRRDAREKAIRRSKDREAVSPLELLHAPFEKSAARAPGAMAALSSGGALAYGELEAKSNQLCRLITSTAGGDDIRVAILMDRCNESLVAILGTLKAGAAYVPLDPDLPEERLKLILKDAAPGLVLTQRKLAPKLRASLQSIGSGAPPVLELDAEWASRLDPLPRDKPMTSASPESPAYLIYTSGTTGAPKGCVVPHRGPANYIRFLQSYLPLGPQDRVLQLASLSFDASVEEIFRSWIAGATLVLPDPGQHRSPQAIVELIRREKITQISVVPSMLQLLLDEGLERCGTLKGVISGGEALPPPVARKFLERMPQACLVNSYGPTEASIVATVWKCEAATAGESVPIGFPVANARLYVLDARLEPVPDGIAGELFIGGRQVSLGYRNRPELDRERFLDDPFVPGKGEKMYRTGDRVRVRPDGALEYLGRIDTQVKIRGFRIETGEIEAVLCDHPGIRQAAVVAKKMQAQGPLTLVAYCVPASGKLDESALRAALRSRLPEYMVPARFVALETIPTTPSGKVDRQSLEARQDALSSPATPSRAPRGPVEARMMQLFAEVLGYPAVGPEDHFFEMGGHSLSAAQLISRIQREFSVRLPLSALFAAPTPEAMASAVEAGPGRHGGHDWVELKAGTGSPLFLMHALDGDVLCYASLAKRLAPGTHAIGLLSPGSESLIELARKHAETIRRIQPAGPYAIAGWSFGGLVAFETAKELERQGQAVSYVGLVDIAPTPERLPSLEAAIFRDLGGSRDAGLPRFLALPFKSRVEKTLQALGRPELRDFVTGFLEHADARAIARFLDHYRALESYRPQGKLSVTLSLFLSEETAKASSTRFATAWKEFAAGGVRVSKVPGGHFSMIGEAHAEKLARAIEEARGEGRIRDAA